MSKKTEPQLLGYTRSSKPVFAPTRGAPDTNNVDTFRKTKARFADWTRGDHIDASILLGELADRTADKKLSWRYSGWASVHWDIGGRWIATEAVFGGSRAS